MKLHSHNLDYQIENKKILQKLSLSIEGPCLTAILGRNGTGKSSLLRCLSGLNEETQNQVFFEDKSLQETTLSQRAKKIAWCPAESSISFSYSVFDICLMGFYPWFQGLNQEKAKKSVLETLAKFKIQEKKNQAYENLSSGEKKLVNLVRTLATPHEVILLDEPTAHLDLQNTFRVFNYLKEKSRIDKNIIIATHDIQQAYTYCDRILLLDQGNIKADSKVSKEKIIPSIAQAFAIQIEESKAKLIFSPMLEKGFEQEFLQ